MLKLIVYIRPFSRYLLIAWVLIIITLSSLPNIKSLSIHTTSKEIRLDYLMHFIAYGFLAFITLLVFAGNNFRMPVGKALLITGCLILFAVADEYHQKLIPGRTFNVNDIVSNISGIIVITVVTVGVLGVISHKIRTNIHF